jgi:predicted ATPase
MAAAYRAMGQARRIAVIDEALAEVERSRERWWESGLHRLKGDLIVQMPPRAAGSRRRSAADAEKCFQHTFAVALRQGARSLELRAAMSLARLWRGRGKDAAAHRLLKETYDWFTEGFDTADLQEARALLTA